MKMKQKAKQLLALTLAALMVNPVTGYAAAHAQEAETITAFAELSGDTAGQQLVEVPLAASATGSAISADLDDTDTEQTATENIAAKKRTLKATEVTKLEGKGTSGSPYQITSADDLVFMASQVNAKSYSSTVYFRLETDIDLAGISDWTPIGNSDEAPFKSKFDGNGKTISNLKVTDTTISNVGLFGVIASGAEVKKIGLKNVLINAGVTQYNIGGIAGSVKGAISECYVTGSINAGYTTSGGGVAGSLNRGTLSNCYAAVDLQGGMMSQGGVVGEVSGGNMKNCYSTGSVQGFGQIGGVAGIISANGTVTNCFATGEVKATNSKAGGTAGSISDTNAVYDLAALNISVSGPENIGRVAGFVQKGQVQSEVAFEGMLITPQGSSRKDGTSINTAAIQADNYFSALFSNDSAWVFENRKLPVLKYVGGEQNSALPAHLMSLAPSAPQNLKTTVGNQEITLQWAIPTGNADKITEYEVSNDNGSSWITAGSNLTYTFTGMENGNSYTFAVRAVAGSEKGAIATIEAIPGRKPDGPKILAATTFRDDEDKKCVTLTWKAPDFPGNSTITEYMVCIGSMGVFVSAGNNTSYTFTETDVNFSVISWEHKQMFQVYARNRSGDGKAVSGSFDIAAIPAKPQSFTATPDENGNVLLDWTAPLDTGGASVTGYRVSKDGGSSWTAVSNGLTHTFSGLTTRPSYDFAVQAYNRKGWSASATKTIKPVIKVEFTDSNTSLIVVRKSNEACTFHATGSGAITYSLDGTIPAGVAMNSATGELTVDGSIAPAGNYSFSINATDNEGVSAAKTFNLTVKKISVSNSDVIWPSAEAITYGQPLGESKLTGGSETGTWAWKDGSIVPTVANSGYDVVFTPKDGDNYDWSGVALTQKVNLAVNRATPKALKWPTAASITYGDPLGESKLTGGSETGTWAWKDGSIVPTVANSGYDVVFTPKDGDNYDWSGVALTQKVNLAVNRATPKALKWPTAASITYGDPLGDSKLTGGSETGTWAWKDGSIVPTVANSGYDVVFTPKDGDNYDWSGVALTQKVNLAVNRATPKALKWPTAASITYGHPLGDSKLTGGSETGTWAWKDGSIVPTVANSGYDVVFTPNDMDNYDWSGVDLAQKTKLTVNPATPNEPTWPTAASITYGQPLGDSKLTGGSETGTWAWKDGSIVPTVANSGYDVVFTPYDTDSYDWSGVALTQKVNLAVNRATPKALTWPSAASITYGHPLGDSKLTGGSETGTWEWKDGSIVPTVANSGYDVVFTPKDGDNYDWSGQALTQKVNLAVNRATPKALTWPSAASITYGHPLGDSKLTGGFETGTWAWKDGSIIPTVANSGYDVVFKPNDMDNYDWSGVDLAQKTKLTVNPATPNEPTWPTAASITYGQPLGDSKLTGGSETGTWAWKDGSIIPTVANSGYDVVFTPKDMDNYDWSGVALTQKVNLAVNRATPKALTWPNAASITYGQPLGDSKLTGGSETGTWAWKDGSIVPTVANSGYDVVFTPKDGDNYDWSGVALRKTVGIAVSKAAVSAQDSAEIPVIYNNVVSGNFNLNNIAFDPDAPGRSGSRSYEVTAASNTDFFSVQPVVKQNTLTYSSSASNTKDTKSTVAVIIKSENYEDVTVTITFTAVDKRDAGVSFSGTVPSAKTYGDGTFTLTASAAAPGQNGTWTWVSSDLTVLNVTGNGASANVQILKPGNAAITAKYESDTTLSEVSTATITVAKAALKVQPKNFSIYTGEAVPKLEVVYSGFKNSDTSSTILLSSGLLEMGIRKTDGTSLANTNTAGAYEIIFTGSPVFAESEKYNIVIGKGSLTIKSSENGPSDGGSFYEGSLTLTTTTTPEKKPNQPITAMTPVTAAAGTNGMARASIQDKAVTDAITKAQADAKAQGKIANGISVELNVTMPKGTDSLTAVLTRSSLGSLVSAGISSLDINGSPVQVSFNEKALAEIQKKSTGNISIVIAPKTNYSAEAKKIISSRPVYDITVSYGSGKKVTNFGKGIVTVSIPYRLDKNEAVGGLYAVYVDAKGKATRITGSAYDANSGGVIFATPHFSQYGIGYTTPKEKFTDISTHWAKESVDYVVGRGLLSGTSDTAFSPNSAMTRGILVTALGRLSEVDTKTYTTSSFSDVKSDSAYRPYIEWAYKKGIIQGIGNNQFAPDRAITREEIAVIFVNYAKATGYTLPITREATTYADASSIGSSYKDAVKLMQQAGIMMGGSDNKFNPKENAARAEVSAMLSRYIKLTINPATAQGWAQNDAGQYMYYKDGKSLTDTQTIDGAKYFFNDDGTLKTGWVKDGDNWHFYSGKTMLIGWHDFDENGDNKTYYFTKDGLMVSGKWIEIDGKWYYFYTDGSLAKSTKIDGYEVDKNGVIKTKH